MLALFTALYGALAGPLLKAIFGGRELQWPASVMPFLPAPPPMASLRQAIPYALVLCALLKKRFPRSARSPNKTLPALILAALGHFCDTPKRKNTFCKKHLDKPTHV